MKKRVALITNETCPVGGLATMIRFLHETLRRSGRYESELISLATSASDAASFQVRSPSTWFGKPTIQDLPWHEFAFKHAGVWGSEVEFQRYRPRRQLTELLRTYDLLQFVVGCPPWVCVAADVDRPIALWTATTTRGDRESLMRNGSIARRAWSSTMVPITVRYEHKALKLADVTFALSEYTRTALTSMSPEKDILLAPCGVDANVFRPATKHSGRYILCVARLSDPRKNVGLLFDAYALLRERVPNAPNLVLIGEPPSAESLSRLQTLGLAGNVELLGPKMGEELAALYRNAFFFVLSSDEEGLGIVILEAMASGLAVVSTNCGGPGTVIDHERTGLLTPIGDPEALAQGMERLLLDTPLRIAMGQAGRHSIEERFSFAVAGSVFLNAYDELFNAADQSTSEARGNSSASVVATSATRD